MPQTYHSNAETGISRYGEVNTMAADRIDSRQRQPEGLT